MPIHSRLFPAHHHRQQHQTDVGGHSRREEVKGMTMMVNSSIYNGYRYEDFWLDN
jgi:hypothetical protein